MPGTISRSANFFDQKLVSAQAEVYGVRDGFKTGRLPVGGKLRMTSFFQRWIVTTLAVLVAANIVPGIGYDTFAGVAVASLLLGLLNAFVRPIMLLISLPLVVYTFGLFVLLINASLLYAVGKLVRTFHVETFGAAFWGGLVISLVSIGVNLLTGRTHGRIIWQRRGRHGRRVDRDGGNGPVIDV